MNARITKTGKHIGYRWQVGRLYGFTVTRAGALHAARKCANEMRRTSKAGEVVEV